MEASTHDWELEDDTPALPSRLVTRAFLFLVGYPLLATVFGGCEWILQWRGASRVAAYAVAYGLVVHVCLVYVYSQVVSASLSTRSAGARLAAGTAFLALPLLAFGYYLGTWRVPSDYYELVLAVLPASACAVLLFDRTRRAWVATLALAGGTFLSFYVVNDFLGPLNVLAGYASNGPLFYFARAAFAPFALLWLFRDRWGSATARDRIAGVREGAAWLLAGVALFQLLPLFVPSGDDGARAVLSPVHFFWIGFPVLVALLPKHPRAAAGVALAEIVLQSIAVLLVCGRNVVDLSSVAMLTQATLSVGLACFVLASVRFKGESR